MKRVCTVFLPLCLWALCSFAAPVRDTVVLPLQVKLINSAVQLNWMTGILHDSIDFVIERSKNAQSFEVLSTLKLSRKTNDSSYFFTDHFPPADSSFYRVSWTDQDKNQVFTQVSGVQFPVQPKTEFNIMPNPVFNNATLIIYHEELGELSCTLYDLTGKTIRSYQLKKTAPYMQHILDMYTVPKGSYILNIRGVTINESKRILKQ